MVLGLLAPAPAHAQVLQGTVRDAGNERPVVAALGYRPYRSTTFETTGIPGVFPVDLLMEPAPVALRT